MKKKELSYKDAFARLEDIHGLLEKGEMGVEELIGALQEAAVLLKLCKERLYVINEETGRIIKEIQS
jgi:exodeoxyribonuclease VII small subunit